LSKGVEKELLLALALIQIQGVGLAFEHHLLLARGGFAQGLEALFLADHLLQQVLSHEGHRAGGHGPHQVALGVDLDLRMYEGMLL
jgi:hypothetical protein